MASFSHQLSVTGDDVTHRQDHSFQTGSAATIGEFGGNFHGGCYRFTLTGIPKDAVISNAAITINPLTSSSDEICRARINAEALDDPGQIANDANWHTARNNTTSAFVDWVLPATTSNVTIATPDISAIIQEIVDRAGWVAGNHIQIFIDDSEEQATTGAGDPFRNFDDVETASAVPAQLDFDWVEAGGGENSEIKGVSNRTILVPGRVRVM